MRKNVNTVEIQGWLYDHKLETRLTGKDSKIPNTPYIRGTIDIATDNAITNIVTIRFSYVTEKTGKGKDNPSFKILNEIINGNYSTYMSGARDSAIKLRITSAVSLNEFYTEKDGKEEFVSAKCNEGGFIHITTDLNPDESKRSEFTTDIIITGFTRKEADPERNLPERGVIKGAIFDYNNAILPVEYAVENPRALDYFESLEASNSNPVYTKVWGKEISETIVKTITQESAFGEPYVREVKSSRKEFLVTGANPEPYLWDDESTITAEELTKASQNREIHLAELKKRREDYKASKANNAATMPNIIKGTEFKF